MKLQSRDKIVLIIVLVALVISLILSQNANSTSPFFSLKRLQENGFLLLKTTPRAKVDYMSHLLDVRLNEFEDLIKAGGKDNMWSSSLRYSTFAGQITDLIVTNNLTNLVDPIKKQFEEHKAKLNELYVAFPKNTDNGEWKYILDAINYLNFNLEKLSKI
jgi:hypothetical protein